MRLLALSCDRTSFRRLQFRPTGLSVIVGDAAVEEGSANGTGKTLALNLVHHCLGADKNKLLAESVPDWRFRLDFELEDGAHAVERNGNGSDIVLDGKATSQKALREWLNIHGPFELAPELGAASFRALYRRFARARREDRTDPVKLSREKDQQALAVTLYLLGADVTLVKRKDELRERQIEIDDLRKLLRSRDARLQHLLRSDIAPEAKLRTLDHEITGIRSRLEVMSIAEDYDTVRDEADHLTSIMRDMEEHIARIDYWLAGIASSLEQRPDIDKEALLSFYSGLQDVFRPEALKHFQDVESFHRSLAEQRKARLERDRLRLRDERDRLKKELGETADLRDAHLGRLAGRHALSEYQSVVSRLAALDEDRRRLSEYLEREAELERQHIEIRQQMASDDSKAAEYLETRPLAWADKRFRALVGGLYPHEAAGITLSNNTRPNHLRYNLHVEIQGQGSDGVNAARVVCFDWLLFMHGARHSLGHLWHDNGFFDHIDPNQRAMWLEIVLGELTNTSKQYIVTLNTENFDSALSCLSEERRITVKNAIIASLKGDEPRSKLLGVQIGSVPGSDGY